MAGLTSTEQSKTGPSKPNNTTTSSKTKKPSRAPSSPSAVRTPTTSNPTIPTLGHIDAIIRDPFHLSQSSPAPSAKNYSASYSRAYATGSLLGTPAQRLPSTPLSALKSSGPRCHDERRCDLHAKGYTAKQMLVLARDELNTLLAEERERREAARASGNAEGGDGNRWVDLGNVTTVIQAR
ncbi:hypothetical protein BST61_g8578 [Cercospora zeina]